VIDSMTENETPPPALPRPEEPWLNRNVWGFGLTSLLADLCYETATAVLPAFLKVLGAPVYALGLMEGAADALSCFVKMGAGWYSDRLERRKPLVILGYAVTAGAIGAMALVTLWPLIVALRVLAWFGKGVRGPARNAMLTASVPPQHKGKAFGFHRARDTIGSIVGSLIAAGLIGWFGAACLRRKARHRHRRRRIEVLPQRLGVRQPRSPLRLQAADPTLVFGRRRVRPVHASAAQALRCRMC
jgi:MFS family permease